MKVHLRSGTRTRHVALAVLVALAGLLVPTTSPTAAGHPRVTVLTRNLYLGSGLTNLSDATSQDEFLAAVTKDWQNVVANDFPCRAKAIATEIQLTRPDVIGLQEAVLFREQLISDIVQGNLTPNADEPVYDFLDILLGELAARGLTYKVVSKSENADAESPRLNAASPIRISDVRLTDYDVILARAAVADKFSNPHNGHYVEQFSRPSLGRPLTFTRGWASIDYETAPGQKVRVFNTHLETTEGPQAQVGQGNEALELINASPYPVIALGDYNSAADRSTTATYGNLIDGGLHDVWTSIQPSNPGRTCCQRELLDNLQPPSERIDLILTKGPWQARLAVRTGALPFRLSPAPLWASDHFGVLAVLELE